ncbi:MAG: type II toxin-antitoxin system YafQ family toxin [Alphaproteobacteria bacterium]|tara:strand:+ start:1277 stop:1552 length:276 start_codon:yes stop_codon:yes gene_type:complete
MYEIVRSTKFKRDVKRAQKQQKKMDKLRTVLNLLIEGQDLPVKNKDHFLSGNWSGYRECHIEPDWLLIYRTDEKEKLLELVRLGSHSDLFS